MEVKVAPIECDLEQLVQRGDAAVTADVQTPPNGWVNLEEQNVEGSVQKIQQKKAGHGRRLGVLNQPKDEANHDP